MSVPPNELGPLSLGMASAEAASHADAKAKATEEADVKAWLARIEEARKFDEGARKQYAIDRKHAKRRRGAFEVDVPIAGTYVDILKSFLYARDPDLDVMPAESTQPPPEDELMRMAKQAVQADPATQIQVQQAGQQAFDSSAQKKNVIVQAVAPAATRALTEGGGLPSSLPQLPDIDPDRDAEEASRSTLERIIQAKVKELSEPYQQRRDDAKQFGSTLEIVVSRLWKKARLKDQAKPQVGSALTVGIGWLKASWQERTGEDPIVRSQINDLQDNLKRLAATQAELAEGAPNPDELKADIERQIQGLQAKVEVVVARGMAIDFVQAEDIQVAPSCGVLTSYRDAPWIAHRTFMGKEAAKAAFPYIAEKIKSATCYGQVKPSDPTNSDASSGNNPNVSATEADSYRKGGEATAKMSEANDVCVWEVWDKDSNTVLTLVEGVPCYARPPYTPDPGTSRFYPFFQYVIGEVDGERHPESLICRSAPLLDEYDRVRSGYAEHRRRIRPKTAFDATNLAPDEVAKIEGAGTQEMVGLKPQRPGTPMSDLLYPVAYAQIDPALYDTGVIRAELEMIWGIQEALSSSIRTAKTATEAEIQQTGTNARTGYMRDGLDMQFGELAEYTAEVAIQKLSREDAIALAGPWAFWPEGMTIDDLASLVTVDIKAGSSGKPDTTRQRQAWATAMPLLQNAIVQVGQLRGSSPTDIADCIEELVSETLARTGDRIDAARFLPPAPDADAMPPPQQPPATPPMAGPPAPMSQPPTDNAPTEDIPNAA
ncbi:hypothetical protein [Luteibacter sp. SG786]|uniref:hypothetical protein n=1 Tax=Luteibacter sp. SG786 TaxID=2587130 RepID=UPI001423AC18|nr:hypothetical protein [Luteibacter sp. SG786]NII54391.1 hypothetical protein [Luteibacter sp. SG786]